MLTSLSPPRDGSRYNVCIAQVSSVLSPCTVFGNMANPLNGKLVTFAARARYSFARRSFFDDDNVVHAEFYNSSRFKNFSGSGRSGCSSLLLPLGHGADSFSIDSLIGLYNARDEQAVCSGLQQNFRIHERMKVGQPILRVKDLDRMLAFYQDIFGLQRNHRKQSKEDNETLELGFKGRFSNSGDPLLVLKDDPKAREVPHNFAGLFHFAVLVPDRKSLAHAYSAIERNRVHFDGFADHLVSESVYLHDPELNGIEIYRDRPRSEWTRDKEGHVLMDTLPLDLRGVLEE
ncbi:MAG: VOC family protein, partial [Nitrososphaerales archaeon]